MNNTKQENQTKDANRQFAEKTQMTYKGMKVLIPASD